MLDLHQLNFILDNDTYLLVYGVTVTVNVAMSLNGMIAGSNGRRVRISGQEDLERVHKLRSDSDVILVGANTVINDNPFLTVDNKYRNGDALPVRVILDGSLSSPVGSNVFLGSVQRTILFTTRNVKGHGNAEIIHRNTSDLNVDHVLEDLSKMGFRKILVEGGKNVIQQFLGLDLVDRFFLYIGNVLIENGGMVLFSADQETRVRVLESHALGNGVVINLDPHSLTNVGNSGERKPKI